jgi:hypothetical protein
MEHSMDLVEEFRRALDGESDVDPFDFKTIISQDMDDEALQVIFEKLPRGDAIKYRVKQLLRENKTGGAYVVPDPENALTSENIAKLAVRYAQSLKEMLRIHGNLEVSDEINPDSMQMILSNDDFLELAGDPSLGQSEAYEELRLIFRTKLKKITKGNFALSEALLGLTNYPQISHFLVAPSIGLDLDTRAYYELWRGGGDVAFLKGTMIVLTPHS